MDKAMIKEELLNNTIQWAREAGDVLLGYFRGENLEIEAKFNDSDIVTVADKASEIVIISHIKETYPDHGILSEESGESPDNGAGYRWIIDPLDGTTNFSSGLPSFAVSIGVEYNGEMVVGVVYAPYLDELFCATKGGGAFLNGRAISPNQNNQLSKAVVATGFPVDKDRTADNNLDNVGRVLPKVRGMRRLGAAAIDLCYVAAGFLDGYWELNLHAWDVAAGELIVSEAGGRYEQFRQDRNVSVVAASQGVFDALRQLIK